MFRRLSGLQLAEVALRKTKSLPKLRCDEIVRWICGVFETHKQQSDSCCVSSFHCLEELSAFFFLFLLKFHVLQLFSSHLSLILTVYGFFLVSLKALGRSVSLELVPVCVFNLYPCTCVCLWRCNNGSSVLWPVVGRELGAVWSISDLCRWSAVSFLSAVLGCVPLMMRESSSRGFHKLSVLKSSPVFVNVM